MYDLKPNLAFVVGLALLGLAGCTSSPSTSRTVSGLSNLNEQSANQPPLLDLFGMPIESSGRGAAARAASEIPIDEFTNPYPSRPTDRPPLLDPFGMPITTKKQLAIYRAAYEVPTDEFGNPVRLLNGLRIGKIWYRTYLYEVGARLGCYFTLETYREGGPRAGAKSRSYLDGTGWIRNDREIKSIRALVAKLREDMSGCVVIQNRENSRIIHLVDGALAQEEAYVVERQVTIRYDGPIGGLPEAIGKQIDGIDITRGGSNTEQGGDWFTRISVQAKNSKIRNLLARSVPLKDYNVILWIADTDAADGQLRTAVRFLGRRLK